MNKISKNKTKHQNPQVYQTSYLSPIGHQQGAPYIIWTKIHPRPLQYIHSKYSISSYFFLLKPGVINV
jgi:hypothetical protein